MKTIAFDFDGVIHRYSEGWLDGEIYDDPNWEIVKTIQNILATPGFSVCIISTRYPEQIEDWIQKNKLFPCKVMDMKEQFWSTPYVVGITCRKVPAMIYVDDRAYKYTVPEKNSPLSYLTTIQRGQQLAAKLVNLANT